MQATTAVPDSDTLRELARARAAKILDIPMEAIEDDLLDFVVLPGGDALLRARAGSGKTTALTIKVSYLVEDLGVDPEKIMMLTFNNAAARSLEARLAACGVKPGVRVRTFHALAQRIVRAHIGGARRCVFETEGEDAELIKGAMQEALDEVATEPFFFSCASKLKRRYEKSKDYVESIGRESLTGAAEFLRARGYGLNNRHPDAWGVGPIAGNAMKVIMGYEKRLKEARLLDPTLTLQAATWAIERECERGTEHPSDARDIDWIFIDEYQDVSLLYMNLVAAIRRLNLDMVNVMGVGDDWQAINGFAGADLRYFTDVADHLESPVLLNLLRNRRSGAKIVEWGNKVMAACGESEAPAVPDPTKGAGEIIRSRVSSSTDLNYIAGKLAELVDHDMQNVALIARKWTVGKQPLSRLQKLVSARLKQTGYRGNVTAMTAHGSKGLEWDQVLLLDDGSFPLAHPARPIMEPLISESEYLREEACLKHVAGTRARKRLDLVNMA